MADQDFTDRVRARLEHMDDAAHETAEALGLPPEAEPIVLKVMGEQRMTDEQLLNAEFEVWARAKMKEMHEIAAAVTKDLGLPQEQRFNVLRALYEAAYLVDEPDED